MMNEGMQLIPLQRFMDLSWTRNFRGFLYMCQHCHGMLEMVRNWVIWSSNGQWGTAVLTKRDERDAKCYMLYAMVSVWKETGLVSSGEMVQITLNSIVISGPAGLIYIYLGMDHFGCLMHVRRSPATPLNGNSDWFCCDVWVSLFVLCRGSEFLVLHSVKK